MSNFGKLNHEVAEAFQSRRNFRPKMLSHHHKCIFVHVPKTGGQSIETAFLSDLGLDWSGRSALLMGKNDNPEIGPPAIAHLTASEYVGCNHIAQEQFDAYFKFSFVRNPWSRVTSFYHFMGFDLIMSFKTFVERHLPWLLATGDRFFRPQSEFLFDSAGHLLVDYVGRFENLNDDFKVVAERVSLPVNSLAHLNKVDERKFHWLKPYYMIKQNPHLWPKVNPWRRKRAPVHYTAKLTDVVEEVYRSDVELFNYSFD